MDENRSTNQWNKTETLEINPYKHSQMNLDKKKKKGNSMEKQYPFQEIMLKQLDINVQKCKSKQRPFTFQKINSK